MMYFFEGSILFFLLLNCLVFEVVQSYELCPVNFHSERLESVPYEIFPYRMDMRPADDTFTTTAMTYKRLAMGYSNGYIEIYDWVNGDYELKNRVYTTYAWQNMQFKTRDWIQGSTSKGELIDFYLKSNFGGLVSTNDDDLPHFEEPETFWHNFDSDSNKKEDDNFDDSNKKEDDPKNYNKNKKKEDANDDDDGEWAWCHIQLKFTTAAFAPSRIALSSYGIHRVWIYLHPSPCKWELESEILNSNLDFGLRIALSDQLLAVQSMAPPVGIVHLFHLPYKDETSNFADIDPSVVMSTQLEILGTSLSIVDSKILVGSKSSLMSHGAMVYCDTAFAIDEYHCRTYSYPHDDFTGYGEVVSLNTDYRTFDWKPLVTMTSYVFHKTNSNSRMIIYDQNAYQEVPLEYVIPPMFDEDIPTNNVASAYELGVFRFESSKICKCLHYYVNRDFDYEPETSLFNINSFLLVGVLGIVFGGSSYYRSIMMKRALNKTMYEPV